ncbi:MAG: hypothetical protein RIS64_1972 [Bacteroidota bacterium]
MHKVLAFCTNKYHKNDIPRMNSNLYVLILAILPMWAHAEGTKQLSPDSIDRVNLNLVSTSYNTFGRYDGVDAQRMYIRIQNPANEQVFLGFSQPRNSSAYPCTAGNVTAYFRIKDPNGNVVFPTPGNANGQTISPAITYWSQAVAGPTTLVGATGYVPVTFNPAGLAAGDYYIEFSRAINAYNSSSFALEWWDITVASKGASPTAINGRVFAKNWALYTPPINCGAGGFGCATPNQYGTFDRPFKGIFYIYATGDSLVTQVNFANSGLRPVAFNLFFNENGPGNTGNVVNDRKSVEGVNIGTPQHPMFLNDPDNSVYPSGTLGTLSRAPLLTSCDSTKGFFAVSVSKRGQVDVVVDLDTLSGGGLYDAGTRDVALAIKIIPAVGEQPPYIRLVPWNLKDGLGNAVNLAQTFRIVTTYVQGIFHLPIYDAEFMSNGFTFTTIRPMPPPSMRPYKLYFDDSGIPDDNLNGQTHLQLRGCAAPCHAWNNGCYGDANTINTWFYGSEERVFFQTIPECYADALRDTLSTTTPEKWIAVLNNDRGVQLDSNSLSISGLIPPAHGTIALDPTTRRIIYRPTAGYIGLDSFQYRVCDSLRFTCDTAWVVVNVNCCTPTFVYAYDCMVGQVQGKFIANGIAGQMGTVTIPIDPQYLGATSFTVAGVGVTGSLSTTLTATTSSVTIPINYDGSGSAGTRLLTITSPHGVGTCKVQTLVLLCIADAGHLGR